MPFPFFSKLIDKRIDRRIAVYQNSLVETHYAEVENMYRQMRGWRHDYRNHIQTMKSLVQSGDTAALAKYLDELDADLTAIDMTIKTGNRMTDAIFNSKISLAKSKGVPVSAEAQISVALTTSELDLCIIIGNLFDNAIEASLALPQADRLIRVFMEMKGSQLYMSFTNMTATKKQKRFSTSKGDGHGFGLGRIDTIVERHQGYIRRNSEDGAFTTEILLPQ
jgi:sensor histidine kinase regulating citrate/malate metabolism